MSRDKKPVLVFHVGVEAGFFSEYNNMIFAMNYCRMKGIEFVLYSDDANFGDGCGMGWRTLFEPFCPEVHEPLHHRFNYRFDYRRISLFTCLYYLFRARSVDPLRFKLRQTFVDPFLRPSKYKARYGFDYYTWELWKDMRREGAHPDQCRDLVERTWRYNERTRARVEELVAQAGLDGRDYAGLHIRGGDKFIEHRMASLDAYVERLRELVEATPCRTIFLLTDDHRIFEELCERLPEFDIRTLCRPDERGYFHRRFVRLSREEQTGELIKLFASVDIMSHGRLFLGDLASNPGVFMSMRMQDRAHGL